MPPRFPLRSILFVPGNSLLKMQKAVNEVPADAILIDWEDAVLPAHKAAARTLTVEFLRAMAHLRDRIWVRLNSGNTPHFQADLAALADTVPVGLVLSKCESAEEVVLVDAWLRGRGDCRLYPMVESPAALLKAYSIAASSPRVAGVAFGAEDFCGEAGITCTGQEIELLFARSALITACRAAGCEPIDSPCLDYRGLETVRVSARRARNLGFSAKLAIHPLQVAVLNEVFSPTEAELAQARRTVEMFASTGAGVLGADGRMIDEAVVRRARRLLEFATPGKPLNPS